MSHCLHLVFLHGIYYHLTYYIFHLFIFYLPETEISAWHIIGIHPLFVEQMDETERKRQTDRLKLLGRHVSLPSFFLRQQFESFF